MEYPVTYTRKMRFSDTDAQGIVFNANYARYWDDAITDYFDALGVPWSVMVEAGYEMVLGHLDISFRSSARLGDTLVTGVRVTERGNSSVIFEARSWIEATGATVVEGRLVQVFVDEEHFRPTEVPDFFIDAVGVLQGEPVPQPPRGPKPLHEPPRPRVRHFEDYVPGDSVEGGTYLVTEAELLGFARQYDPQAIHIDPEVAAGNPFGGLITSGWHNTAIAMRMLVEHYMSPEHVVASPGIEEIRFLAPVRAGDELTLRATVEAVTPSRSKPDRGTVHTRVELSNQDGTTVLSMLAMSIHLRRPADGSQG